MKEDSHTVGTEEEKQQNVLMLWEPEHLPSLCSTFCDRKSGETYLMECALNMKQW